MAGMEAGESWSRQTRRILAGINQEVSRRHPKRRKPKYSRSTEVEVRVDVPRLNTEVRTKALSPLRSVMLQREERSTPKPCR